MLTFCMPQFVAVMESQGIGSRRLPRSTLEKWTQAIKVGTPKPTPLTSAQFPTGLHNFLKNKIMGTAAGTRLVESEFHKGVAVEFKVGYRGGIAKYYEFTGYKYPPKDYTN